MKKEKDKKKKREKRLLNSLEYKAPQGTEATGELSGKRLDEPLEYFLSVAGGKWKIRILWALRETGSLRYRSIKAAIPGITDMMLSQSLCELTESGMVRRKQFQEIPPRVEYQTTPAAQELLPVIAKIIEWEKKYHSPELENQN